MESDNIENDPRVYEARDLLLAHLTTHERICRDPDCKHAVGLAAFIAHSLGVAGTTQINLLERTLEKYNRECAGCTERN
jgi:hypothetical protein